MLPFAKSLDTLGFFTHTPADMLALWEAMGHPGGPGGGCRDRRTGSDPAGRAADDGRVSERACRVAARRGRDPPVDIAGMLADLHDAATHVEFYEGARFHEQRYQEYGARLAHMGELVREGLTISVERYDEARRHIAEAEAGSPKSTRRRR